MWEEIRLLLRELVTQGGGDAEAIAPVEPPWLRSSERPPIPDVEPVVEEEIG